MFTFGKPQKRHDRGAPSKFFYVRRYCTEEKKQTWVSTKATSLEAARIAVRRMELEAADPKAAAAREREGSKLKAATTEWLELQEHRGASPRYLEQLHTAVKTWCAFFGDEARVADITTAKVQKFLADRKAGTFCPDDRESDEPPKPLSPATVNGDRRLLGIFFGWAARGRLVDVNPVRDTKPYLGEMKRRIKILTPAQERALIAAATDKVTYDVEAARNLGGVEGGKSTPEKKKFKQSFTPPPWLRVYVVMALYCGLRTRTLISLTWSDIDLDGGALSIPGSKMKSGRPYAAPLNPIVVAELKRYRKAIAEEHRRKGTDATAALRPDERVLGLSDGTRLSRIVPATFKRAGLKGYSAHSLRGAFINRLLSQGTPIHIAMKLSDHSNLNVVAQHYMQASDDDLRAAVNRLSETIPEDEPAAPARKRKARQ